MEASASIPAEWHAWRECQEGHPERETFEGKFLTQTRAQGVIRYSNFGNYPKQIRNFGVRLASRRHCSDAFHGKITPTAGKCSPRSQHRNIRHILPAEIRNESSSSYI
jgi:hypothetical protein